MVPIDYSGPVNWRRLGRICRAALAAAGAAGLLITALMEPAPAETRPHRPRAEWLATVGLDRTPRLAMLLANPAGGVPVAQAFQPARCRFRWPAGRKARATAFAGSIASLARYPGRSRSGS